MRGFSFAEVMVCVFLLACAVLGLLSAHLYLLRSERGNKAAQQASLLAYDRLNERLADAFAGDRSQPRAVASPPFECAVSDRPLSPGLKELAVSVYWSDSSPHEFRLTTRIYDVP